MPLLKLAREGDNLFAQYYQLQCGFLQLGDKGECPLIPKVGFYGSHRLIVVVTDGLELMVEIPESFLGQVKSAGAVFLGKYAPEPLGDYVAGPNHTLPTSGAAKFASPLGVYDFLTRTSIIRYSYEDLKGVKDEIVRISDKEGLTAHGNAVKIRFGEL